MSNVRNESDAGFSIVEALVALFVFAVAAVALVEMQAGSIRTLTRVEQAALAEIVADNLLVDVVSARPAPPAGDSDGQIDLGGRQWRWSRSIQPTVDPRTLRVLVSVAPQQEPQAEPIVRKEAFFDADPTR